MDHGKQFDPRALNDPVALKTSWTPINSSGSNFQTHTLVVTGTQRLEFRPTLTSRAGVWSFLGVGVCSVPVAAALGVTAEHGLIAALMSLAFGAAFGAVGSNLAKTIGRAVTIDRGTQQCYRGKPGVDEVSLRLVHALQLVSQYHRGNKRGFFSYELNLVMRNGTRHNLVEYGARSALLNEADDVAKLLGVPLWDAT